MTSDIYILMMFFSNLCAAQNITWKSNNFKSCIKIGIDNFTMEAAVQKTTKGSIIAKSALFEIKSSNAPITIVQCSVSNFDNCGIHADDECYCSKKTSDELIIVFRTKSNSSLIGSVVTVRVPCAEKEITLVSGELVITHSTDTSPVLKINMQEYDVSNTILYSKVPVEIEFCCDNSLTHCKAHIERNNERIDNWSNCVSFHETSNRPTNLKMYSTLCNHTTRKADMMFFPEKDEPVFVNSVEYWQVVLICIGVIMIYSLAKYLYKKICCPARNKKDPEIKITSKRKPSIEQPGLNSDGMVQKRHLLEHELPNVDVDIYVHS